MDNVKNIQPRYKYSSISASGQVGTATFGVLNRIIVTASSSGVITVYDNTAASGTKIINALSVAAKDNIEINAGYATALYVSIDSGTATVTVLYN